MSRGRLRRALKAVRDYIRYDLREIVAPRSLPDPPGRVLPKRLTLKDYWQVRRDMSAMEFCGAGAQLADRHRRRDSLPTSVRQRAGRKRSNDCLQGNLAECAAGGARQGRCCRDRTAGRGRPTRPGPRCAPLSALYHACRCVSGSKHSQAAAEAVGRSQQLQRSTQNTAARARLLAPLFSHIMQTYNMPTLVASVTRWGARMQRRRRRAAARRRSRRC